MHEEDARNFKAANPRGIPIESPANPPMHEMPKTYRLRIPGESTANPANPRCMGVMRLTLCVRSHYLKLLFSADEVSCPLLRALQCLRKWHGLVLQQNDEQSRPGL